MNRKLFAFCLMKISVGVWFCHCQEVLFLISQWLSLKRFILVQIVSRQFLFPSHACCNFAVIVPWLTVQSNPSQDQILLPLTYITATESNLFLRFKTSFNFMRERTAPCFRSDGMTFERPEQWQSTGMLIVFSGYSGVVYLGTVAALQTGTTWCYTLLPAC